ncbi:MAG: ankyrin repeat domain-containing protein [Acidobacteria bacterium]|nr:ankyrin repeat domain-containing protein [Acidobacteriota bacterium]
MNDPGGSAALFDAIEAGDCERIKAMLAADPALVGAHAPSGESAIIAAVYHRQKEIANLLIARGAPLTIFEASAAGEVDRLERLLSEDPPAVRASSPDGWTPLHLAAFFGHVRPAEMLLAAGADVAARSRNSTVNTPLHAALAGDRTMVAALLIGAGADVNAADAGGWRPIHQAAHSGSVDLLKQLIAQGADLDAENGDGKTAYALAQERNHREAAALLRRHAA